MDYRQFIKKWALPRGFTAPSKLVYDDVEARALTRSELQDDVRGINTSIQLIQETRGGGWPTGPVTEEDNFVDIVWHELEFREATSFTYAVYRSGGEYLGCCYLYPMGRRTELTEELLHHDVDVSWWVTPDAYQKGYYAKLHSALSHWLAHEFPFQAPYYSNRELPPERTARAATAKR
jgi:RimJ/RimL family protein N-acetyltransferase